MIVPIALLIFSAPLLAATPIDSSAQGYLDAPISLEDVQSGRADEFYFLCRRFRFACGEELLSDDPFLSADDVLRPATITIRKFLDGLIERHPQYYWDVEDGVLVVRPRVEERPSPLDRRIEKFVHNDTLAQFVLEDVARLEGIEVIRSATIGLTDDPEANARSVSKRISVRVENKNAREVLNACVHAHGHAMWTYRYARPKRFVPNYFLKGSLEFVVY
jgi:hypothetical protein